jgi:translation initiation factor 2B subunit (eIF-2B alpha/beta/delta family)
LFNFQLAISDMAQLRRIQTDTSEYYVAVSPEGVLTFNDSQSSQISPHKKTLNLVHNAGERTTEAAQHATSPNFRAESLVKEAIEKLKLAQDRVESAEAERQKTLEEVKAFSDRIEKALGNRLQEIDTVLEQANSRVATAELQLAAAEERVRATELRAIEAENALRRMEAEFRMRIIEKIPGWNRVSTPSGR